jgi:hypothetical protein
MKMNLGPLSPNGGTIILPKGRNFHPASLNNANYNTNTNGNIVQ